MKIGLFTDTYHPQINGVTTSILMLQENLQAMGHEVFVFTTTDPGATGREENIYRIPSIAYSVSRIGTFVSPRLIKTIKRLGIEVIHTHTEFTLGILGKYMARSMGIPLVHTMHTMYEFYTNYVVKINRMEPAARAAARKMTSLFCNGVDRVIVPTGKIRDLLLSYGITKPIVTIPTGLELERFDAQAGDDEKLAALRQEFSITNEDKVLVNIGRISREKNLDEIIRAMQKYLPTHPNVKLLIVGDGPAREELQGLAMRLGMQRQVVFAGARPWSDIRLYYKLGDVFVGASQSETQGLTYMEAMACAVPLVVKQDRCLDGVLAQGENGYAFLEEEGFLQALEGCLHDETELKRLSCAAAETAQGFSATQFAQTVLALYQETIEESANKHNTNTTTLPQ